MRTTESCPVCTAPSCGKEDRAPNPKALHVEQAFPQATPQNLSQFQGRRRGSSQELWRHRIMSQQGFSHRCRIQLAQQQSLAAQLSHDCPAQRGRTESSPASGPLGGADTSSSPPWACPCCLCLLPLEESSEPCSRAGISHWHDEGFTFPRAVSNSPLPTEKGGCRPRMKTMVHEPPRLTPHRELHSAQTRGHLPSLQLGNPPPLESC